jgi:uncharacterized protein YjiS (DUF1127 family)
MTVAIAFVFVRIVKFFVRLKRAIEAEFGFRHAIAELNDMSDYMLRDLGITRGDIEHVVRRPCAWTGMDEGPRKTMESIVPGISASRRSDASVPSVPTRAA